jgi:predicted metal-dependent phosphoesterase TrpH
VTTARAGSIGLLIVSILSGTASDRPRPAIPLTLGGHRVLAADFHVHSSMWSDGALTPWGLVFEAQRQGLDAMALTGHNQVWDGKAARRLSRLVGGPTVLAGQEILGKGHHVIAVGIHTWVDGRLDVSSQIDEVHRQGGVAIAAHPFRSFWPAFDDEAMKRLDGAEICHPIVYGSESAQRELEAFATRGAVAAIGSSDFHGIGRLGMCRTYVFAQDDSPGAILEAVRARRTVVYGRGGKAYGDPDLVRLAEDQPRLRETATDDPRPGWLEWVSRVTGVMGLLGCLAIGSRLHRR